METSQLNAIYQSILEVPDDRLSKLALADMLQEYGNEHSASLGEYIHRCLTTGKNEEVSAQQVWNWYAELLIAAWPGTSNITGVTNEIVLSEVPSDSVNKYEYVVHFYANPDNAPAQHRPTGRRTRMYRIVLKDGLIMGIKCPFKVWVKNAGTACRYLPITQVVITDRYPVKSYRSYFTYYRGSEYRNHGAYVAPPIYDHLYALPGLSSSDRHKSYPSLNQAVAYLSMACVNYGRSLSPQLNNLLVPSFPGT